MIPVIIPTPKGGTSDGVLYGNLPTLEDYASPSHSHEPEDNKPVSVVPDDALQALLRQSGSSFAKFERRFTPVSDRQRAEIMATFRLIEWWRTGNPAKRTNYLAWKSLQIDKFHKELAARGSPVPDSLSKYVIESQERLLDSQGLESTVTASLNRKGEVRVWWNATSTSPSPGILVPNFVEALFALLLLNLENPESIAECPCGEKFPRTKTTQIFHSARCANKYRKARQREKEREEGAKRGTRKTR